MPLDYCLTTEVGSQQLISVDQLLTVFNALMQVAYLTPITTLILEKPFSKLNYTADFSMMVRIELTTAYQLWSILFQLKLEVNSNY